MHLNISDTIQYLKKYDKTLHIEDVSITKLFVETSIGLYFGGPVGALAGAASAILHNENTAFMGTYEGAEGTLIGAIAGYNNTAAGLSAVIGYAYGGIPGAIFCYGLEKIVEIQLSGSSYDLYN